MKIIKYNLCETVNRGTNKNPKMENVLPAVKIDYNEENEEIAKKEAYNGEYTIVDAE